MATVNFSVPNHIKSKFDRVFAGQNKSQLLSRLMLQAVEEEGKKQRRKNAIEKIIQLRRRVRPVNQKAIRTARKAGRP